MVGLNLYVDAPQLAEKILIWSQYPLGPKFRGFKGLFTLGQLWRANVPCNKIA